MPALLLVAFVDELQGGGPVLAAEDLRLDLDLSAGQLAAVLFTIPFLVGTVLEPLALVASERWDRRRVLVGSLLLLSAAEVGVVAATGPWTLAAALSAWGIAVGLATTVAEVALVASREETTERMMVRWAFWGVLGDLAAPVLFGAAAAVGLGWRWVVAAGAAVSLVDALLVARGPPLREEQDEEEEEVPVRVALVALARQPAVWLWLGAAALCSLLDETFVAFGTLWLRASGVDPVGQGAAFAAFAVGGAVGLRLVERAAPTVRGQLTLASVALVVLLPAWLLAPPVVAVPATALLGAAAVPLWPLCTARAYDQARPGLVAALSKVFGPLDLALPLLLGVVADRYGLVVALLLLLAQPLGILGVLRGTRKDRP